MEPLPSHVVPLPFLVVPLPFDCLSFADPQRSVQPSLALPGRVTAAGTSAAVNAHCLSLLSHCLPAAINVHCFSVLFHCLPVPVHCLSLLFHCRPVLKTAHRSQQQDADHLGRYGTAGRCGFGPSALLPTISGFIPLHLAYLLLVTALPVSLLLISSHCPCCCLPPSFRGPKQPPKRSGLSSRL